VRIACGRVFSVVGGVVDIASTSCAWERGGEGGILVICVVVVSDGEGGENSNVARDVVFIIGRVKGVIGRKCRDRNARI